MTIQTITPQTFGQPGPHDFGFVDGQTDHANGITADRAAAWAAMHARYNPDYAAGYRDGYQHAQAFLTLLADQETADYLNGLPTAAEDAVRR